MKRPTVSQINEYMEEREFFTEDQAETFFDHFESKGWMIGKSKMKCWKAAIRNWIRNAKKWGQRNETHQQTNQTHSQRQHEQARQALCEMEPGNPGFDAPTIRTIQ